MKTLLRLAIVLGIWTAAPFPASAGVIKHVIVIAMENSDASQIYGNTVDAPYINNVLMPQAASAANFNDTLPVAIHSEPHYIIMEAGTSTFADHTFTSDDVPSAINSTGDARHLTRQIGATAGRVTWTTYQQGMNAATGACPILARNPYAPKHDPFVFFRDISGNPPSTTANRCVTHHRPYTSFAAALAKNKLASYVFITPDQCHDMHTRCGADPSRIRGGDNFLQAELPAMITWANQNASVIFIVWDEGETTIKMPFLAVGSGVKKGYVSNVALNQRSLVKSLEEIFGLPILPAVRHDFAFGDLFDVGAYP